MAGKIESLSYHVTANSTNTPWSGAVRLRSLVICVTSPGTAWSITIQSKEAAPKVIYQSSSIVAGTVVVTCSPEMVGGIDIITSGTTAGVLDVFITAERLYHDDVAGAGAPSNQLADTATSSQFIASDTSTRTAIAALAPNQGNFFDSQSYDPCIIVNPNDSSQLLMFFTGMAAPVSAGMQSIGRATANVSDPTNWTVSNAGSPVLTGTLAWESSTGVRANTVVYNPSDGKLYLFYTGNDSSVGLATSTDLGLTWTKLGQILVASGTETAVSQLSVLLEGTTLHGLYSYRTATATLPALRYASASTTDWTTWTKQAGDVYSDGTRFIEQHQLIKIGSTYIVIYESGGNSSNWDIRVATSVTANGTYSGPVNNPWLVHSGKPSAFDNYHVSTPCAVKINGYWYLFESGALDHSQPYYTNHWQLGVVELDNAAFASPPDTVAGLEVWLKADSLFLSDGNAIATWVDQSASGNDATQATVANQPIYKAAIVNNLPVARFDGTDDTLLLPAEITLSDFTAFVVFQTSGDNCFLGATSQNRQDFRVGNTTDRFTLFDGSSEPGSSLLVTPRTQWNYGCVKRASGVVSFYEKGTAIGGGSAGGTLTLGAIGSLQNPQALYTSGDIAEVIIYNSALSDTDRQTVETYLANKYGL